MYMYNMYDIYMHTHTQIYIKKHSCKKCHHSAFFATEFIIKAKAFDPFRESSYIFVSPRVSHLTLPRITIAAK